ncbi:MAG: 50S ribosomal protein L30 [Clostridia bacterium]|nr:50S ribosomal protein L30 [Clostridia bacterium]
MADLKITLIKSTNKAQAKQKATVAALGLRKIGQSVVKADNAAMRGMVKTVSHLVACEEV